MQSGGALILLKASPDNVRTPFGLRFYIKLCRFERTVRAAGLVCSKAAGSGLHLPPSSFNM